MSRRWADVPDHEQESIVFAAKKMLATMRMNVVAGMFDVSVKVLRNAVDPEYRKRARRYEKERNERIRSPGDFVHRTESPRSPEIVARLAEIPPDFRSLTGRTFGDPLPGRSALERRR